MAKERTDREQGAVLRRCFEDRVLPTFSDRVLSFDLPSARLLAAFRVPEHAPLDALIGAVAQADDVTVGTRNTRHFDALGVTNVNPWDRASWDRNAADPG